MKDGNYHGRDVRIDGLQFRPDSELLSNARAFEGVWNTMIGVSYQFDFKPYLRGNPRNNTANDALKDDGVTKKYKKMRYKSNLGTGKPRYSKSSAMKKHQ